MWNLVRFGGFSGLDVCDNFSFGYFIVIVVGSGGAVWLRYVVWVYFF